MLCNIIDGYFVNCKIGLEFVGNLQVKLRIFLGCPSSGVFSLLPTLPPWKYNMGSSTYYGIQSSWGGTKGTTQVVKKK